MITREAQLKGSKKGAETNRQKSINAYYQNPRKCLFCGEIIELNGQVAGQVRKKKFCNRSCAASYNNSQTPKRIKEGNCNTCGKLISKARKYCDICLTNKWAKAVKNVRAITRSKRAAKKPEGFRKTKEQLHFEWLLEILSSTKGDLRKMGKHPYHYKSTISRVAREIYKSSDKPQKCIICGYSKYIDVCHIKQVSEFPDTATIKEINSLSNLIAMCKTHHWELDHGDIPRENLVGR
jgi:hypothetical protein